jgi:hypothetical protein
MHGGFNGAANPEKMLARKMSSALAQRCVCGERRPSRRQSLAFTTLAGVLSKKKQACTRKPLH